MQSQWFWCFVYTVWSTCTLIQGNTLHKQHSQQLNPLSAQDHISPSSKTKRYFKLLVYVGSLRLVWYHSSLNLGQGPSRTAALGPKGHNVPSYLVDLRPEICPRCDLYRCHPDGDAALRPRWQSFSPKVEPCPTATFAETHHEPQTHFSNCINFFWEKCVAAGRGTVTLKQS